MKQPSTNVEPTLKQLFFRLCTALFMLLLITGVLAQPLGAYKAVGLVAGSVVVLVTSLLAWVWRWKKTEPGRPPQFRLMTLLWLTVAVACYFAGLRLIDQSLAMRPNEPIWRFISAVFLSLILLLFLMWPVLNLTELVVWLSVRWVYRGRTRTTEPEVPVIQEPDLTTSTLAVDESPTVGTTLSQLFVGVAGIGLITAMTNCGTNDLVGLYFAPFIALLTLIGVYTWAWRWKERQAGQPRQFRLSALFLLMALTAVYFAGLRLFANSIIRAPGQELQAWLSLLFMSVVVFLLMIWPVLHLSVALLWMAIWIRRWSQSINAQHAPKNNLPES